MSEKYKVGLSRNRLFEFNNAVVFYGKLSGYNKETLSKALKLLCLKEPLVTAVAILQKNGECYIETDSVTQEFVLSERSADEVKKDYAVNGLDFTCKLFEFVLCNDGYLVIGAHTLVADCKSLLRLAMQFAALCENGVASVSPSGIETFEETTALPMEVNSPLTDKLSAELDSGWQKKHHVWDADDYKKARKLYDAKKLYSDEIVFELDDAETAELMSFCDDEGVDLSSVVAFAIYKALYDRMKPQKKHSRMCIHADRRLFLQNADNVLVGAFNGFCEASLSDKERELSLSEQIKAFHNSCYKGITSPFKTFYDEVLLMKVSPSYCDSAYMYLAGVVKDKVARKLAQNYGCMNEQLCEFFSCNLDQEYWAGLKVYADISVSEPLKDRFALNVSFLRFGGVCKVIVKFNNQRLVDSDGKSVICEAKNILKEI